MMKNDMNPKITCILFDLGGVLVELNNFSRLVSGSSDPRVAEEFWNDWLHFEVVKAFESGKITFPEFVSTFLHDHQLSISKSVFIKGFKAFPKQLYDGVEPILRRLAEHYQLGVFSNNNPVHWEAIVDGMGLRPYCSKFYSSHLLGKVKPDLEAFWLVLQDLARPPAEILFLDDHLQNVKSARDVGMHSERVKGAKGIEEVIKSYGLL